jgi:hypothetical protein
MDPVVMEKRHADNIRADSIDGGAAAPSYADLTTLLDNSGDVRIPESTLPLVCLARGNSPDGGTASLVPRHFAPTRTRN